MKQTLRLSIPYSWMVIYQTQKLIGFIMFTVD